MPPAVRTGSTTRTVFRYDRRRDIGADGHIAGGRAGQACLEALAVAGRVLISAGTLTEALIVSAGQGVRPGMQHLLDNYGFTVMPVTEQRARLAGEAYERWGKGFHVARLNFGDCFAYALAEEHACPLLYVGQDFARTDVAAAL